MKKKAASKTSSKKSDSLKSRDKKNFLVVGLGASAGGVKALKEFFAAMPPNSGMAFVVILHLSPQYESKLDAVLQAQTMMPVTQVNETVKVEPNHVYVISPNHNLEMTDGVIRPTPLEINRGSRVAIDIFLRTLAEAYERNAVCVVMSGTGSDGTLGLKRVKESNGFAIVQEPNDAEYDQMPRSAIATNLADWILPVAAMPKKLLYFKDSSERLHLTGGDPDKVAREIKGDESLREILTLLRIRTGHDFSSYKQPTIIRRIARHLQIHELEDIPSYLSYLREHPEEIQSLLRNLLINVTNFFRDKEAFESLEVEVIPNLFAGKTSRDTVRVWTTACASGEEAYSMAMLLSEHAERFSDPPKIQIFASDVDEEAIAEARRHVYPETIAADVSEERLRRFFIRENHQYHIKKELREMVLFAPHNVLHDPPFSRLDLITCRNLLIYLNRETQERILRVFHFALNSNGFLFLGSSESADGAVDIYHPVNKKHRIYKRRAAAHKAPHVPLPMPVAGKRQINLPDEPGERRGISSAGETHYKLVEKYAPPSVLVNTDFEIIHLSESAGRYLRFAGGEPSNNLLKMAHTDLLPDLRAALFVALREGKASEIKNIRAVIDGEEVIVNLYVRPARINDAGSDFIVVMFDERQIAANDADRKTAAQEVKDEAIETVVRRLEEDLQRTKNHLRLTIEQHETAAEELKSTNEELQAINEELRSSSEELETSKEELQSVNEELVTVNSELKEKIDEAVRVNTDFRNLIDSTDIATVFLDRDLQIKRFTPFAEKLFNITPADIGRPLEHFTNRLEYANLAADAARVLETGEPIDREITGEERHTYMARFHPYLTLDGRIDGVVLNFIDITRRKETEEAVQLHANLLDTIEQSVIATDLDGIIIYWNQFAEKLYGWTAAEALGHDILELMMAEEMREPAEKIMARLRQGKSWTGEFETARRDGTTFPAQVFNSPVTDAQGKLIGIVGISVDITERQRTEEALRESEEHLRLLVESATDYAIFTLDKNNVVNSWNAGAERIFGWKEKEIIGKSGRILFTPEDRERGVPEMEMQGAIATGKGEDERWHIRKDGTRFFASGVTQPLQDSEGFVKICRDQTEKIKTETALRDRDALQQMVGTQEDERRRIARDLHDHLGQQMTALRLKLDLLKKMCDDKAICEEIEETEKIAEQLDRDVDFLAWELRPAALDDLGLRVTLSNFVKQWSLYTGIKGEFHASGLGKKRLPFEIETNLYRIGQEALNNIHKHAKAKSVSVLLEKRKDEITLIIEDNGIGFNAKNKLNRTTGIGLLTMRERAAICGGTLEIESARGKGTTIFARVPVKMKLNSNLK